MTTKESIVEKWLPVFEAADNWSEEHGYKQNRQDLPKMLLSQLTSFEQEVREEAIRKINEVTGHASPKDHSNDGEECMTCDIINSVRPN